MRKYPNIILIAGNDRNIGKTLLACRIIKHLTELTDVYAVKISPHFHELDEEAQILSKTDDFCIVKETMQTCKDSSRMLMAGATEVFYVQCKNQKLPQMFDLLQSYLPNNKPIIIESGGLHNVIEPRTLYYIKGADSTKKPIIRDGKNPIILSTDEATQFNIQEIFTATQTNNSDYVGKIDVLKINFEVCKMD